MIAILLPVLLVCDVMSKWYHSSYSPRKKTKIMDQEEIQAMYQKISQAMVQTFADGHHMQGLNDKLDNLIKIQEMSNARLKTIEKQIKELDKNTAPAAGQRLAPVGRDVLNLNQTHRHGKVMTRDINKLWLRCAKLRTA